MDDFVNILASIENDVRDSEFTFRYDQSTDRLHVMSPLEEVASFRLAHLYRPSSSDVLQQATKHTLLVIMAATEKAAAAASQYNHIMIPKGRYRIIAPGVALIREAETRLELTESRQAKLMGRTGVIAESLLLGGKRPWSVRNLAVASSVSPGLAQRVVHRLEREGLLTSSGSGPEKTRILNNPKALAELWSQEEKVIKPALRGFLYGSSNDAIARMVVDQYPGSAVGEAIAANLYAPVLTRVTPPVRIWVPNDFNRKALDERGFKETNDGANLELLRFTHDPWQVHMNSEGMPRVSNWRAWIEVSHANGRVQELADALLAQLEEKWHGSD